MSYEHDSLEDCIAAGTHLVDTDEDEICTLCGESDRFVWTPNYCKSAPSRHCEVTDDDGDCLFCGGEPIAQEDEESENDDDEDDEEEEEKESDLVVAIAQTMGLDAWRRSRSMIDTKEYDARCQELHDSILNLSSDELTIYRTCCDCDEFDGAPNHTPTNADARTCADAVLISKTMTLKDVIRNTRNMLQDRVNFLRTAIDEPNERVYYLEMDPLIVRGYEEAAPSLFIGKYVKLFVPASSGSLKHELLWVQVTERVYDGDGELTGCITSTPRYSDFKKGEVVSFVRSEVLDLYGIDGELGSARRSTYYHDTGTSAIVAFYNKTQVHITTAECLTLWKALSDQERVFMTKFYEYIKRSDAREQAAAE